MASPQRLLSNTAETPRDFLTEWRQERAHRVSKALCSVGVVFSFIAAIADFFWSDYYVFATDFILFSGCALSLYWSFAKLRPRFFWWPLFWSFWISLIPSFLTTGGINSPFFSVGMIALYVFGAVMDSEDRSIIYLNFVLAHYVFFYVLEKVHPLSIPNSQVPELTFIVSGLTFGGIAVCIQAMLRTERDLSLDFADQYESMGVTEAELKTSEGQLREAQSIASVGSWEWDVARDHISWSDELYKIFGVNKDTFGSSYKDHLKRHKPEDQAKVQELIHESMRSGRDFTFESRIVTADGDRFIQSRGRVVKDRDGNIVKMMGTSQDITERKHIESQLEIARDELEKRVEERTQQLEQSLEREKAAKKIAENANQAKMQFLANMSHEIRTPMNSILGFSELLASRNHTPDQGKEYLDRIRNNGKQLLHLIDDILDLSKFEAGLIPIQNSSFVLRSLVNDVVNSFLPAAKAKNIRMTTTYTGDCDLTIFADSYRLSQVLNNLLSNSVKFSDHGEIKITVSAATAETQKILLTFDIEDNGIGILAENQKNLFQPFSQGDSSIARKFGGSGLGLALSKRIAEALGGSLKLKNSIPGKGTHFTFQMPADIAIGQDDKPAAAADIKPDAKSLSGKHILLAEDSPDNAMLVCHYLKSQGATVEVVTDGIQAVKAASEKPFSCILMDIQMPGMDGLEATRRIRAQGYKKPIIALTAHALAAEASKSIAAGCDLHLTKPISKNQLIESLNEQLAASAMA